MIARVLGVGAIASVAGLALVGCNALTGADDLRVSNDDDDEGSGSGATSAASGPASGSGGASTSGPTSGAGGATTGAGGMGGDGGSPTVCMYPPGPYGVGQGQTAPPTLTWQGYAPGASQPSTLTMQDLFDCDGTHGIDALYFDTSQYG